MNQHKIPQWLIKNFAFNQEEKKVHLLSCNFNSTRQKKKLLKKTQEVSIERVFSTKDIHKFEPTDLEQCFSSLQNVGVITKKITVDKKISLADKARISGLMYSLLVEDVIMELKSSKPIEPWQTINNTVEVTTKEKLRNSWIQEILKSMPLDGDDADIKDLFIPVCKRIGLQSQLIFDFDWNLLKTESINCKFVIGDKPILLIPYPTTKKSDYSVPDNYEIMHEVQRYEAKKSMSRRFFREFSIIQLLTKDYIKQFYEIIFPISPTISLYLKRNKAPIIYNNVKELEEKMPKTHEIQIINSSIEITKQLNFMMYWQSFDGVVSNQVEPLKDIIKEYDNFQNEYSSIIDEMKKRTNYYADYFVKKSRLCPLDCVNSDKL